MAINTEIGMSTAADLLPGFGISIAQIFA